MKTFFDTSAFAKRFFEESGSENVEKICYNSTYLALSIVCLPEIISALNRRLRKKNINSFQYSMVKNRLLEEVADVTILNITPAVVKRSIVLLELNILRGVNSLHIACACEWGAELFVSGDKHQILAAEKAGLKVQIV
ncbi:type II toxin-antitoxin system VapC family toxin [candidate division KSB1 bacterium]|nr:type II toxin-antitoxin system VapC family toxin [candidate division KSB1 bacterium]